MVGWWLTGGWLVGLVLFFCCVFVVVVVLGLFLVVVFGCVFVCVFVVVVLGVHIKRCELLIRARFLMKVFLNCSCV